MLPEVIKLPDRPIVPVYLVDMGAGVMTCVGEAAATEYGTTRLYVDVMDLHQIAEAHSHYSNRIIEYYNIRKYLPDLDSTRYETAVMQPATMDLELSGADTHAWVPSRAYGKPPTVLPYHPARIPPDLMATMPPSTVPDIVRDAGKNQMTNLIITALVNMLGGGKIKLDLHDLHVAREKLVKGDVQIFVQTDPEAVTIEIKED